MHRDDSGRGDSREEAIPEHQSASWIQTWISEDGLSVRRGGYSEVIVQHCREHQLGEEEYSGQTYR